MGHNYLWTVIKLVKFQPCSLAARRSLKKPELRLHNLFRDSLDYIFIPKDRPRFMILSQISLRYKN